MLQMLIKPLLGVASDAIGGYVETRKAKAEQKLTAIKAETEIKKKQIRMNFLKKVLKGK